MPHAAESEMIDKIRIIIIAVEITLPIRQSCWCAGYGNWKTWWMTESVWLAPTNTCKIGIGTTQAWYELVHARQTDKPLRNHMESAAYISSLWIESVSLAYAQLLSVLRHVVGQAEKSYPVTNPEEIAFWQSSLAQQSSNKEYYKTQWEEH